MELFKAMHTAKAAITMSSIEAKTRKPSAVPVSLNAEIEPVSSTTPPKPSSEPKKTPPAPPVETTAASLLIQIAKVDQWNKLVVDPLSAAGGIAASIELNIPPDWGKVLSKLNQAISGYDTFIDRFDENIYPGEGVSMFSLRIELDLAMNGLLPMITGILGVKNMVSSALSWAIHANPQGKNIEL
jgi:hypothetical protein